jgi:hypothetical protein
MNKLPRGYNIEVVIRELRTKDGIAKTTTYRLVHIRKGIDKIFISEEAAVKHIQLLEFKKIEDKALSGKGAYFAGASTIINAGKDLEAANELSTIWDDSVVNTSQIEAE